MRKNYIKCLATALCISAGLTSQVQAQSFSENFNDISTLTGSGWFQQNNSSPSGANPVWFQGNPPSTGGPFIAYNGAENAYIAVNFNSTAGGSGTISNWLGMPNRTFRNGDVLTFYTRKYDVGDDYPDRMEVRLSTNGASTNVGTGATDLGDFSTLLLSINPSLVVGGYPRQWEQQTITISGLPAPASGRIAFRYFVTSAGPTGTNSDYIGIDQVDYTPYVCPAFTMTPGGALSGGTAGGAYSHSLTQTGALGAPNYAVTGGAVPPGVTLGADGSISGTPTATGTFNFTTTVSDASGCSGSQSYSITVVCGPNTMIPDGPLTAGTAGSAYTYSLAQLGAPSSGYTVTPGTLPPGLTLADNGTISGTPTATGTFNFSVDYTNPYGCPYSRNYSITVSHGPRSEPTSASATVLSDTSATVSWSRVNTDAYGGTTSGYTVTAVEDNTKTCTAPASTDATISCDVTDLTPGATYTFNVVTNGDGGSSTPHTTNAVTMLLDQTINFTSSVPVNATVGAADYTVTATGGASDNPVVFSIDPSSGAACSLSGSNVVLLDAVGTCTINANQGGNSSYAAAAQVQQSFTIAQANSTVILSATPNPAQPNQPITFNVSIALNSGPITPLSLQKALALPSGTIEIHDGDNTLISSAPLVNGMATIATIGLDTVGTYQLIASYSGDTNYPAGQSAVYRQTISPAFTAPPVAVPTLNQWSVILLALALMGFAMQVLRRKNS